MRKPDNAMRIIRRATSHKQSRPEGDDSAPNSHIAPHNGISAGGIDHTNRLRRLQIQNNSQAE